MSGKRLYLDGIVVPLARKEEKSSDQGAGDGAGLGLLQVLVKHSRKDILTYTQIDKLIDKQWITYGERMFRRKLTRCLLLSLILFLMTVQSKDTTHWVLFHLLLRVVGCTMYYSDFIKLFCVPAGAGAHYRDWERIFVAGAQPCILLLGLIFLWQHWGPAGSVAVVDALAHALYVGVALLTFANTLYLAMGFETIGRFILVVAIVCYRDLPTFLCVYLIFLAASAPDAPRPPRRAAP